MAKAASINDRLTNKVIIKILLTALIVASVIKLAPLLLLLFLGLLIAITLYPVEGWLKHHGLPHWAAVLIISIGLTGLIVGTTTSIIPPLTEQLGSLVERLPEHQATILKSVPENSVLHPIVKSTVGKKGMPDPTMWLKNALSYIEIAFEGIGQIFLVLILAVYLLLDGKKAYGWLLAFFEPTRRKKIHQTAHECSEVVFAYVAGQALTSLLATVYAYSVLSILHVPAALILAVLAGIFDILPILGFFLSTIPAVLLALTVSPQTALFVVGLYLLYHGIENYLIVPKVYGNRLRLSTLAVLIALLA